MVLLLLNTPLKLVIEQSKLAQTSIVSKLLHVLELEGEASLHRIKPTRSIVRALRDVGNPRVKSRCDVVPSKPTTTGWRVCWKAPCTFLVCRAAWRLHVLYVAEKESEHMTAKVDRSACNTAAICAYDFTRR